MEESLLICQAALYEHHPCYILLQSAMLAVRFLRLLYASEQPVPSCATKRRQ